MQIKPACLFLTMMAILCLQSPLFSQTGEELNEKANQEFSKGNTLEALKLVKMALEKIKTDSGENSTAYVDALSNIATVYINMNQLDEAEPFSTKAVEIITKLKGEKSLEYAYHVQNVGNIALLRREFDKAERVFQESISIMDKYSNQSDSNYLFALNSLSALYYYTEEYNKAMQIITMVADIYRKDHPRHVWEYMYAISNLGELYRSIGSYGVSLKYFNQALQIFRSGKIAKTDPLYAKLLSNMGVLHLNMLEFGKSEAYFKQAISNVLTHYDKSNESYVTVLNNLGQVQYLEKKYDQAIKSYQEVLKLWQVNKNDTGIRYAATLNNLAQVYIFKGDLPTADSLLAAAKRIYAKQGRSDDLMFGSIIQNQGVMHQLSGNNLQAFQDFSSSQNIYINYLNRNFYGLSEKEKLNLAASMQQRFQALPYLLQQKTSINSTEVAKEIYHAQLTLKNIVLRDQQSFLRTIRNTHDSSALQLYTNWKNYKSMLAQQSRQQGRQTGELDSLERITNQLEQSLAQKSSFFAAQQQYFHLSAKSVSARLQQGEAAVEFLRFSSYSNLQAAGFFYAALVLQPGDSLPKYVFLCREEELTALLQPATCSSQETDRMIVSLYHSLHTAGKPSKGDILYNRIWKPLLPYFKETNTVYIAPAGLLYQVAFQAIPAGDKQMLGDRYEFRYLLSTGDIAVKQLNTGPDIRKVSFWGNMTYDRAKASNIRNKLAVTGNAYFDYSSKGSDACKINLLWPALRFGQTQVKDLEALCRPKNISLSVHQRSDATEDMLKEIRFDDPSVLHISTHGFFIRDPAEKSGKSLTGLQTSVIPSADPLLRSGIVFSGANRAWSGQQVTGREDGIVTAYEIAQMDLSNTPLVILDACESALGSIYGSEGVFGLQRAFRLAGADKIIMSLWKVPEKETNELMKNFYHQWLGGKPVYKALRDAQQEMRKKNLPPYYWAGFIVAE
ncbi:MAG: CHAT domain-containing protein [Williamsia sp.]|nr:CHAT domain-containing protein [Williamsia sp.]